MDWIIEMWKENLSPFLTPLWASLLFWRTLSLIFITLLVLSFIYRNRLKEFLFSTMTQEHDRKIFDMSSEILRERRLIDFLDDLESDDSYWSNDFRCIQGFLEFFRESGNQYKIKEINKKAKEFLIDLKQLATFLGLQFFVHPAGQQPPNIRLCLHPEMNIDRAGYVSPENRVKYGRLQDELYKKCSKVREKYQNYRESVKSKLSI